LHNVTQKLIDDTTYIPYFNHEATEQSQPAKLQQKLTITWPSYWWSDSFRPVLWPQWAPNRRRWVDRSLPCLMRTS